MDDELLKEIAGYAQHCMQDVEAGAFWLADRRAMIIFDHCQLLRDRAFVDDDRLGWADADSAHHALERCIDCNRDDLSIKKIMFDASGCTFIAALEPSDLEYVSAELDQVKTQVAGNVWSGIGEAWFLPNSFHEYKAEIAAGLAARDVTMDIIRRDTRQALEQAAAELQAREARIAAERKEQEAKDREWRAKCRADQMERLINRYRAEPTEGRAKALRQFGIDRPRSSEHDDTLDPNASR